MGQGFVDRLHPAHVLVGIEAPLDLEDAEPLPGAVAGQFDGLLDRRDADGYGRLDAIPVAAQQAMKGQSSGQAQEVVKGEVERAQGRWGGLGQSGQFFQCVLDVERVQVAGTVGAGPASPDDALHVSPVRAGSKAAQPQATGPWRVSTRTNTTVTRSISGW